MKFSTETVQKIEQLIVAEFAQQIEREEVKARELEEEIRNSLQAIGRNSYGKMLSLLDQQHYGIEADCECGQPGKRVSQREVQVLSVFGRSTYRRSYYQCKCGRRWYALDEEQGLRAGQATDVMSGLLGLAGITVSFAEASRQIKQYLQVEVSANTIRQETQRIGEKQAVREQTWIEQSQDIAYLQERERHPKGPKQIYGSIDGAFVPLEEEWKEAKTVSWYQVGPRYGNQEQHAHEIAYYTSLEPAETFGSLLWGTGVHHQADRAQELIFVCDGATWIWKLIELYFPSAVQIVDWYHACQYLYAVAEALSLPQSDKDNWITEMKTLLWDGQIEDILKECRSHLKQVGHPAKRLISYYTNNLDRMQYADFRAKDYFIGSGTVESACKQIVAMRLKRSGARWTHHGASLTAKARTAWLSNSWQSVTQFPLAA
jgi:hypothetical protein